MAYLYLSIAIISEVIATSALKAADGFSNPLPSVVVIIGYSLSFYLLSIVLRTIPVGVAYAIWTGVGVVLVAVVAAIFYKQMLDLPAMIGMGLIIIGVIVMNVFSNTLSA